MAYAAATERIKLGTGVPPMYSRTPVAAQQAATIDEFSGGRMVLGIGVSTKVTVELVRVEDRASRRRDARVRDRPARDVRGRDVPPGSRFPTQFRFIGLRPRPDLPIYIAGLSRRCCASRRDRRWRDAVAVQPGVHPPGRRPGGHRGGASAPARGWRDSTSWPRSRQRSPTIPRAPSRPCAATSSPTGASRSTAR